MKTEKKTRAGKPAQRSRQAEYQHRRRAEGKCPKCGEDTGGFYYCEYHRKKEREKQKRRYKKHIKQEQTK